MRETSYSGKDFEADIKNSIKEYSVNSQIECCRLYDVMYGKKGIANIADFILYSYPILIYLECKATQGKRFDFSRLTDTQLNGLINKAGKIRGVYGGVIVMFYEYDQCYFLPIEFIQAKLKDGKHSVNLAELETVWDTYKVDIIKKRTRYFINLLNLFYIVSTQIEYWGD